MSADGEWRLYNPIPDLVKDRFHLKKLFEAGRFLVPYAKSKDRSAHSTLKLLFDLYELSSNQKIAVNAKMSTCFGHGLMAVDSEENEQKQFFEYFSSIGVTADSISRATRSVFRQEAICGTGYFIVRVAESKGQFSASIDYIPSMNALPAVDPDNPNSDFNGILFYDENPFSNNFTLRPDYVLDWKTVGIYPKVTQRKGVYETAIRVNSIGYEHEYWGRPVADTNWLYVDYQMANHTAKVTTSEVVSKVIMLLKSPNPLALEQSGDNFEEAKTQAAKSIRDILTSRGKSPEGLGIIWYDEEKPEVKEVALNRDSAYMEKIDQICIQKICAAHEMPATLCNLEPLKVGLGGNVLLDLMIKTSAMTIMPTQVRYIGFLTQAVSFILSVTGQNFDGVSLKFKNPLTEIIEQLKKSKDQRSSANTINEQEDTSNVSGG